MTNVLIDRLCNVFEPPEHVAADRFTAYVAEIEAQIACFDEETLNRAASSLIRKGGKSWPSPKAIVDACTEALGASVQKRPETAPERTPWAEDEKRAREWARDFCQRTPLGQQAFDEGWGRPLFLYAMSFAREAIRRKEAPDHGQLSVSAEWLTYYRGSANLEVNRDDLVARGEVGPSHVTPPNLRWLDRAALLRDVAAVYEPSGSRRPASTLFRSIEPAPEQADPAGEMTIGKQPVRIQPERRPWPPADRDAWRARFGKESVR